MECEVKSNQGFAFALALGIEPLFEPEMEGLGNSGLGGQTGEWRKPGPSASRGNAIYFCINTLVNPQKSH
jgi:hypothetical protein